MSLNQLPGLHDALVERIVVDWLSGLCQVQLTLMGSPERVETLSAANIKAIRVTRDFEWGPSESINRCEFQQSSTGGQLFIEMQSGDTIEISCTHVELQEREVTDGKA
jgi:hypothetical protein